MSSNFHKYLHIQLNNDNVDKHAHYENQLRGVCKYVLIQSVYNYVHVCIIYRQYQPYAKKDKYTK